MTEQLTTIQRAGVAEQLRNAVSTIEALQEVPLDTDQACTIYDLCQALEIQPVTVLDEALNLIEPGKPETPPLVEVLTGEPGFLEEMGRALQ